ncbi:MAG: 30S ribosome-binding factor RbfA [Clostridia bacterium]|nr:30S ribosome-binding factor RbfA [Clostridia bacterium]MDE6355915.1 30S ribosome-binding factor RbfA [Clostridia bacterium]MDE7214214.1 30S ribosome-binding factor RbfA [Clostridia bacterium]
MKGVRGERLAGEFQKEIHNIINNKVKAKEPSLSVIISVTGADVAPDLKSAKVFISVYDTDKARAEKSFEIIKENAGFIRRELSRVMTLRTVPELRFILDTSMEYGQKIDKLIYGLESKDERKD